MKRPKKKKCPKMRWTDKRLRQVTGKWLKGCYKWLVEQDCGCCHIVFGESGAHEVCVCVGWTDDGTKDGKVAWKIGWRTFNNGMQTDLDIDFDMPWNTKEYCDTRNAELKAKGEYSKYNRCVEGDVYDTQEILELKEGADDSAGLQGLERARGVCPQDGAEGPRLREGSRSGRGGRMTSHERPTYRANGYEIRRDVNDDGSEAFDVYRLMPGDAEFVETFSSLAQAEEFIAKKEDEQ